MPAEHLGDRLLLKGKGACGVFGVLRREGAARISSSLAVKAIDAVRFRGSSLGAGYATFSLNSPGSTRKAPHKVDVFVDGEETASRVRNALRGFEEEGLRLVGEEGPRFHDGRRFGVWSGLVEVEDGFTLARAVASVNASFAEGGSLRARVFSCGRFVSVFKEVGYPLDVARLWGLMDGGENAVEGDLWLAHTRQPTNSPGTYPVWSHPFAYFDCAIVHNGDISSFGANMQFLRSRGIRSFVGTDSEVIAFILDYLLRVKRLPVELAAQLMINPYERWIEDMVDPDLRPRLRALGLRLMGARLDGPFTVIAGYSDGEDVYLMALVDRSKFRPIVVGEDQHRYYIASEECSIRAISPEAKVWTPEPGGLVLMSMRRGVISAGRRFRVATIQAPQTTPPTPTIAESLNLVDAWGKPYREVNEAIRRLVREGFTEVYVKNVSGHRYLGVGLPPGVRLTVHGNPGNCLANFNMGATITVYGNAADDVGDAMTGGRVVIHGDARDIVGQALQGGEIYVRGNVGNRAAIQMREYADRRPYLIVGGRADDYFGEYMAGGVAVVLGLSSAAEGGESFQPVGDFVATGMVGGMIYVRGRVRSASVGLKPPRVDVLNYLETLTLDGDLDAEILRRVEAEGDLSYESLKVLLPPSVSARLRLFFEGKYVTPLRVEHRTLTSEDLALLEGKLSDFFREFSLGRALYEEVLSSKFTVITPKTAKPASPQEERLAEE